MNDKSLCAPSTFRAITLSDCGLAQEADAAGVLGSKYLRTVSL